MLRAPSPFRQVKFRSLIGYLILGSIPYFLISSIPLPIVTDTALIIWIHGTMWWWGNRQIVRLHLVRAQFFGQFSWGLLVRAVGIAVLFLVFSFGIILLYYYTLVVLFGDTFLDAINDPAVSSPWGMLLGLAIVPIVEEFMFRGIMLHVMVSRMGFTKGILFTSVLFGIAHFEFISATIFGIMLALLYIRYRSLWLPIIVHVLNNAIAFLPSFFMYGSASISAEELVGDDILIAGLVLVLLTAPIVGYLFVRLWPKNDTELPYLSNVSPT